MFNQAIQMFYVDFLVLQLPVMKIDVGHTHEQLSDLGYQVTVFPPVKQYFFITDFHLGKSCTTVLRFFFHTLSFTLIGVLEAKMEFSLWMRKEKKKKHDQIETLGRNLSAYTQYSTALQWLKENKRICHTHTHIHIYFIQMVTNMKSEIILPHSLFVFSLRCCVGFCLSYILIVFQQGLNHVTIQCH